MIPIISAAKWNQAMAVLREKYPIQVRIKKADEPTHTWKVTPEYDMQRKKWGGTVNAGTINAKFPTVSMAFNRSPKEFQDWYKAVNQVLSVEASKNVEVPLNYRPRIVFPWREIGGDALPESVSGSSGNLVLSYEKIPPYFKKQGVREAGSTASNPNGYKRLFACDIVVRQPRESLLNDISSTPAISGGSLVSVNAIASTAPPSLIPKLFATSKYTPPKQTFEFSDIFFQRFNDNNNDEIQISTVYALSPLIIDGGDDVSTTPDETYTVLTRYYAHYNMAHATRSLPRLETQPLTLQTGLAAGLGDAMYNYILSDQNDYAQSVIDMFQQRSLTGLFWEI